MKKIMFNDRYGLTQAVLDGRKTMTRRIATELNHPNITDISEWGVDRIGKAMLNITYDTGLEKDVYPHYQIGEDVAVGQRYNDVIRIAYRDESVWQFLVEKGLMQSGGAIDTRLCTCEGYNNKMFVCADLMPHRIRITDIKVERLQDISEEDCMKEGVFKYEKPPLHHENDMYAPWPPYVKAYKYDYDNFQYRCNARAAFKTLIDRISGKGTWERNPWVYAYEFELIK